MTDDELQLSRRIIGFEVEPEDVFAVRKLDSNLGLLQKNPAELAANQAKSILQKAHERLRNGDTGFEAAYFIPHLDHQQRMHEAFMAELAADGWAVTATTALDEDTDGEKNISDSGMLLVSACGDYTLHLTQQFDSEGNLFAYRYQGHSSQELGLKPSLPPASAQRVGELSIGSLVE